MNKIMKYTIDTNIDEEKQIIDKSLINTIETKTDNGEVEKVNILETEMVLGFWDIEDYNNINRKLKKEALEKMTELELLESKENFSDLEFSGKEKGDFLIEKQLKGNPHKESQYARLFDATVLEFLITEFDFLNKIPADKKLFIEFLMKKSKDTETILKKFNKI